MTIKLRPEGIGGIQHQKERANKSSTCRPIIHYFQKTIILIVETIRIRRNCVGSDTQCWPGNDITITTRTKGNGNINITLSENLTEI